MFLPAANATSERPFSAPKRVKASLCATRHARRDDMYIPSWSGRMKIRTLNFLFASITINLFRNISVVLVILYKIVTIVTSYTNFDEGIKR